MSVRQMLNTIDSRELSEWVAYDTLEPVGSIRTDLVGGVIASTVGNCHRGKNQQAFSPTDFMPLHKTEGHDSVKELGAKLDAIALTAKGVKVVRHDNE